MLTTTPMKFEELPPPSRTSARSTVRIATPDGAAITLHAYGDPGDARLPVLLCHGACSNHVVYDLDHGRGLAPSLARDGRRVFTVDLRGRARSVIGGRVARARTLVRGWTIDHLLLHDLPTAIAGVLAQTRATALDYVGHSLGGMLIAAHLAKTSDARVRRVVSVGSGDFATMDEARGNRAVRQLDLAKLLAPITLLSPVVPIGPGARALSRVAHLVPSQLPNPTLEAANVEPDVLAHYLRRGLVSVSSRKFRELRELPAADAMSRYVHPTLYCAGEKDLLVSPASARSTFTRAASPVKRLVVFGRAHGHMADYGHSDLLIGRHAHREVFPEIHDFLGVP